MSRIAAYSRTRVIVVWTLAVIGGTAIGFAVNMLWNDGGGWVDQLQSALVGVTGGLCGVACVRFFQRRQDRRHSS